MILPLFVLTAAALFYIILNLDIPGLWKFAAVVIEMFVVGNILITKFKLTGEHGLIMLRSQKGLDIIHSLAKYEKLWNFFADVGVSLSYGLLSIIVLRKNISVKSFITGMILLVLLSSIVAPNTFTFLSNVIKGIQIERSYDQLNSSGFVLGAGALIVLLLLGGLFFMLLASIITYGIFILGSVMNAVFYGTQQLDKLSPGATFLLPGHNLPFIEGILALLIILVVHEGAHAVLARIGRIKILSSGIVLFGIIPIGAFVEPDEEQLKKLEQAKQTRVLVAGSTSNLITSVLFFILFLAFNIVIQSNAAFSEAAIAAGFVNFFYILLGLGFALNFIIGTVNLLPLPFFDGYRILELNVPQKKIVDGLMIVTLIAFLMNFLPWLFVK